MSVATKQQFHIVVQELRQHFFGTNSQLNRKCYHVIINITSLCNLLSDRIFSYHINNESPSADVLKSRASDSSNKLLINLEKKRKWITGPKKIHKQKISGLNTFSEWSHGASHILTSVKKRICEYRKGSELWNAKSSKKVRIGNTEVNYYKWSLKK